MTTFKLVLIDFLDEGDQEQLSALRQGIKRRLDAKQGRTTFINKLV